MSTELFTGQRVPVAFQRARLKKEKDGRRLVSMEFAVPLKTSYKMPAWLKDAFTAVSDTTAAMARVELDRNIAGQNLTVFPNHTGAKPEMDMRNVTLENLAVDRIAGLTFDVETKLTVDIGAAVLANFGNTVLIAFEPTQLKFENLTKETK